VEVEYHQSVRFKSLLMYEDALNVMNVT